MSTVEVTLPENTTTEETEVKDTEISEEQETVVETPEGAPEGDAKETEDTPEISEEKALETEIKDQTKAIEDATTLLSDKGINYEALTAEYDTNGSISAESYAALEKAGFPASVVNAYIAGVEATQNKIVDAVYRYAGGQAEYKKVTAYIQAKGKEDVDSFNALIDSGNVSAIKMVIAGAKAEMQMRLKWQKQWQTHVIVPMKYIVSKSPLNYLNLLLSALTTKYYEIKTPIMGVFLYLSNI